ncbi:hypothetical protein RB195_023452 [Necator americanus]|uniref:Uncharacterized protein n=1 Tax=Necator americanus TaxID=51031 RepID=A0ABR1EJH8_NECAM
MMWLSVKHQHLAEPVNAISSETQALLYTNDAVSEKPSTKSEALLQKMNIRNMNNDEDDGIGAEVLKSIPSSGTHELTKIICSV